VRGRVGVPSELPDTVSSVLEIVVDGLNRAAIAQALAAGVDAASRPGVIQISAGNYGGKLGKHHFRLHELVTGAGSGRPAAGSESGTS
jgi:formylmethanofuran--tetrahydromethanopterin N-formyltransferase